MKLLSTLCLALTSCVGLSEIDFPGPQPGPAKLLQKGKEWTLTNRVLSASWSGALRPVSITNRLSGNRFNQTGSELFRIALTPPKRVEGVFVGIRLSPSWVSAVASPDGNTWTELAHFPRSQFGGNPKLVRLGKMNLKGESRDNPGDLGDYGVARLSGFNLSRVLRSPDHFNLHARAHQANTIEFGLTKPIELAACRIEKLTDKGMSWGPGMALVWDEAKKFVLVGVRDGQSVFNVTTQSGERIVNRPISEAPSFDLPASQFHLRASPTAIRLKGDPRGQRLSDRQNGWAIQGDLESPKGLVLRWRAELRDGSNYIHQALTFLGGREVTAMHGLEFVDARVPGLETIGTCPGSPVAAKGLFMGVELPGSQNRVDENGAKIGFGCQLQVGKGNTYQFGSVVGVAPVGQLRRAFLCYIERERARLTQPFLHYNCWYDLGYGVDAAKMLDAVKGFHDELVTKRGVQVSSFLVDDGWDDVSRGLWQENLEKFPGGFGALRSQMAKLDAHLAVWISPLGGYGGAEERTADAVKLGIIPKGASLDLAHPGYKAWFQKRCLQLMREGGVNAFKWDRAGDGVSPHFMALLDIAHNLRKQDPNLFINVTVGTWPSPFWLNHVDSTWRNGSADVGWTGKGDVRERWLTFRDGYCHRLFVEQAPLYPLNSVMHHGIVHGREFQGEPLGKSGAHLLHEARSYFANGTSLQELYLTPSMMTSEAWDAVADAATWAHQRAEVLADSHWVGGDPLKLEPYGYAAWNRNQGTLMLRNPGDEPQTVEVDPRSILELPQGAPRRWSFVSPYPDQRLQALEVTSGAPKRFVLQPFEVVVFDVHPSGSQS